MADADAAAMGPVADVGEAEGCDEAEGCPAWPAGTSSSPAATNIAVHVARSAASACCTHTRRSRKEASCASAATFVSES